MGFWKSAVNLTKRSGQIATGALSHGGSALKTAAVGGTAGYVAWETLVKDKPLAKTASEMVIGAENTEKFGSTVDATIETVNTAAGAVKDVAQSASSAISSVGSAITGAGNPDGQTNPTGVGNFIQGITSGNGLGMIGDFFRNIGEGKVSGMSFAGLIVAALLIFGRFGWLGKIVGAMIGMSVFGNNLNLSRIMGGGEKPVATRGDMALSTVPEQIPEQDIPIIKRGR